ncbi:MAG: hypothetical protein MK212_15800 [Saprospiraceae bacterium]|nr:hypothetical protein [Saprospiraceae bacterium]
MAKREDKFDPMASFRQAQQNQSGLPGLAESTFVEKKEEKAEDFSKQEQLRDEKKEEKGTTLENEETPIDSVIEFPPKFVKVDKNEEKRALPSEEETEEEIIVQTVVDKRDSELELDPKERKTKLTKLKKTTSKVLVSQGDKLQSTLVTVIFDWRGESGLEKAETHRDLLLHKVTQGKTLDKKEREALVYAQDFIQKHQIRKEDFKKEIPLSEADKEELVELLGDYLEVSAFQPSPLLVIGGIVLVTLFSNLYTAFTIHPKYNPPI